MSRVKVGIVGSRFQADCIAAAVTAIPGEAELVAVASPTPGNAEALARRHGIPAFHADYREMLRDPAIELVSVAAPNRLHAQITIDAARAGKHVVCEKPLCMTLEEADAMIDACAKAGVLLLYGEELFFAPKYVKAKQMADEGAFGRIHLVKQGEKHSGPHSAWFWDVEQSGGGAVMDLGCHGIAFCWWFLGKPKVKSVYAQLSTQVHAGRTQGDDEAITILEFEGGALGVVENSWNRPGGMDDAIEVFGAKGQTYADMLMGNALPTYSEVGFGYAVEKAATTKGWTYPVFEEHWNYGFPQEMRHFARCVRGKETPISDGETGRVVQEVLYAAYASAGLGRKVTLPFRPTGIAKPIDLWKQPEAARPGAARRLSTARSSTFHTAETGDWFDIRGDWADTTTRPSGTAMSRSPIILLAGALVLGCAQKHENVVHVIAEEAPGLKKGARVQFRGVDVGLVKQVYFTPGGVRIDLLIERDDAPIRAQDTVRFASVGAFGGQIVDIQPGPQTAPLIRRGATLPKVEPESTVSLPVSVWRSIVRMVGSKADSTAVDTAAAKRR